MTVHKRVLSRHERPAKEKVVGSEEKSVFGTLPGIYGMSSGLGPPAPGRSMTWR
jgi:hypothetical protein